MKNQNESPKKTNRILKNLIPASDRSWVRKEKQFIKNSNANERMFTILAERYRQQKEQEERERDLYGHKRPQIDLDQVNVFNVHPDCDDLIAVAAILDYYKSQITFIDEFLKNDMPLPD